jgi:protein O-mannosyl-transferase
MSFSKPWIGLALLCAAFGASLFSSFHFDDYYMLADPAVTAQSGWREVFALERTRSLTYLTFWANYRAGGEEPLGYHALNLLLHAAASVLVWLVYRRLLLPKAAALGALVFALHPLQSEPVVYVFARATLLAALLCLLCWRAWIGRRYWVAAAWFAAALLAKEEAIAFPAFLAAFEWLYWGGARPIEHWRAAFGVMLALAAAAAARLFYAAAVTEGSGAAFDLGAITPGTYLLTQGRAFWEYARLLVLPLGQNIDRDFALSTGWDETTAAAWAAALVVVGVCLAYMRMFPSLFWVLGGIILLSPSSSFVPLADLVAERRMYLPMVSLCAGIGLLLARVDGAVRLRRAADAEAGRSATDARLGVVAIAVIAVLTVLSWQRTQVWMTEESLWRDTVEKSPGKARPKLQLARALGAQGPGREGEQLGLLQEARTVAPHDPDVTTELGVFYLQRADPERALRLFDEALGQSSERPQALANRGAALFLLGRREEAIADWRSALAEDPCNFDARNNLIHAHLSESANAENANAESDSAAVRRLAVIPEGCRFSERQRLALEAAGR